MIPRHDSAVKTGDAIWVKAPHRGLVGRLCEAALTLELVSPAAL
jgi:hypothetical protein